MPGATYDFLETEVRQVLLEKGLDPQLDGPALAGVIDEAISHYEERADGGSLPLVADRDALKQELTYHLGGLGPLQAYLDDPDVEEIWINERLPGDK